jgi:hypothetical protein
MVRIDLIATVSNGSENRSAVRDLTRESSKTTTVAVDFYAWQAFSRATDSNGDPIPAYNCTAMFFGKTAETVLERFQSGMKVRLVGEQVQTTREYNGKTYINNDVRNAQFYFVSGIDDSQNESAASSNAGSYDDADDHSGATGAPARATGNTRTRAAAPPSRTSGAGITLPPSGR